MKRSSNSSRSRSIVRIPRTRDRHPAHSELYNISPEFGGATDSPRQFGGAQGLVFLLRAQLTAPLAGVWDVVGNINPLLIRDVVIRRISKWKIAGWVRCSQRLRMDSEWPIPIGLFVGIQTARVWRWMRGVVFDVSIRNAAAGKAQPFAGPAAPRRRQAPGTRRWRHHGRGSPAGYIATCGTCRLGTSVGMKYTQGTGRATPRTCSATSTLA